MADLLRERIVVACDRIPRAFLHSPQFVGDDLSAVLGRAVVVKKRGSDPDRRFKGRGTWPRAEHLELQSRHGGPDRNGDFAESLARYGLHGRHEA